MLFFLFVKDSGWEISGIDVHFILGICQSIRNSPGIDFSVNRSLGVPAMFNYVISMRSRTEFYISLPLLFIISVTVDAVNADLQAYSPNPAKNKQIANQRT